MTLCFLIFYYLLREKTSILGDMSSNLKEILWWSQHHDAIILLSKTRLEAAENALTYRHVYIQRYCIIDCDVICAIIFCCFRKKVDLHRNCRQQGSPEYICTHQLN